MLIVESTSWFSRHVPAATLRAWREEVRRRQRAHYALRCVAGSSKVDHHAWWSLPRK